MIKEVSQLEGNASLNLSELVELAVKAEKQQNEIDWLRKENAKLKEFILEQNCTHTSTPFMLHEKEILKAGITDKEMNEYLEKVAKSFGEN